MISRHPHVFGDSKENKTAKQQVEDWESIKASERKLKKQGKVLDDSPQPTCSKGNETSKTGCTRGF